jgi:diaminopimelate decarboxylase
MTKPRILSDDLLRRLAGEHGTPLFVYSTEPIRRNVERLRGFDTIRYAQKASSNLSLLRFIRTLGVKVDSVSAGELQRALVAGFSERDIELTADLFDRRTLELLACHDVHVNLGSADMIEQYAAVRPHGAITLRINPGFGHGHDLKVQTGGASSKHGIWFEELPAALERARRVGLRITGLHIHIGSGSDFTHLSRIRHAVERDARIAGEHLLTISTGGGLPIPYRPGELPFDADRYTADWLHSKRRLEVELDRPLTLEVEPGRFLVAESGVLLCEVRATKRSGEFDYVLVDAGFDNLARPAMYGAYHHVSIVGRDDEPTAPRVVAGPLCESADMFTQTKGGLIEPRDLPPAEIGDLVCIHDCGAYAASMASNYNTRPHAAEVLVNGDDVRLIARRQTIDEVLACEIDLLAGTDATPEPLSSRAGPRRQRP